MSVRILALLALVALSLAFTACGDDDNDDAGKTTGSKTTGIQVPAEDRGQAEKFIRQGQALCRKLERESLSAPASASAADQLRIAIAASERFYRRLAALQAPVPVLEVRGQLIAVEQLDDLAWKRVVREVESGTPLAKALAPEQAGIDRNRREAEKLYDKLGLTDCKLPQASTEP